MSIIDEKEIKQQIKNKEFSRLYLIFGEESYLKKFYTDKIISENTDGFSDEFNYTRLEGKSIDLIEIFDIALQYPMMSDKRVVVVDDFKFDGIDDKSIASFEENVQKLPDTTVLIFYQDTIPCQNRGSGKKIRDCIEKNGCLCELKKRSGPELYNPLISMAKKQGCELSKELAKTLVEMVGDEFNVLVNELNKLCSYVGEGKITLSHIETIATQTPQTKVYFLTDNLIYGKFDKAFECFDILRKNKTEPEYILGVITSTFVDMYRLRTVFNGGGDVSDLRQAFDYKGKDFVLQKAQKNMRSFTIGQLKKCIEILSEADMKLKLSRDDAYFVLEQLLVKLTLVKNQ